MEGLTLFISILAFIVIAAFISARQRDAKIDKEPPFFDRFIVRYGTDKGYASSMRISNEWKRQFGKEGEATKWRDAVALAIDLADCSIYGVKDNQVDHIATFFGGRVEWHTSWRPTRSEKVNPKGGRDRV